MALPRKPKTPSPQGQGGGQRSSEQPRRPQRPAPGGARPSRPSRPQPVENPYDTEDDRDVFTSGDSYYYTEENDSDYENDYEDVGFEDMEESPRRSAPPRPQASPNRRANAGSGNRRKVQRAPEPEYNDDYQDYNDEDEDSGYFDSYESEDNYSQDPFDIDYDGLDDEEIEELEKRKAAHDFYEVDQEEVAAAAKSKRRKNNEKKNKNRGFFNSKDKKRKKDKNGADVYVNEKTGKLEPYAKRKIKVSEFDDRKNRQKKATYIQWGALALGVVLVGAGLKNAIIPPETLTPEEVEVISLETVGATNYPEERAKAVAENFVQAYLAVGNGDVSSDALEYFYTGTLKGDFDPELLQNSVQSETVSVNGGFNQKVVLKPSAYESVSIDDNTGYFTVGALVKPDVSLKLEEDEPKPKLDGAGARWIFFTVNVYYDDEKDTLYVTKDSPTIVPDKEVGATGEAPDMGDIGTGEEAGDDVQADIEPVIFGYISGYANSSLSNQREIKQYLAPSAEPAAKSGLNGDYELNGSEENAISYKAFTTGDPNELKVKVKVSWLNKISIVGNTEEVGSIRYSSNYIATLVKSQDGGWLVKNFDSLKFVPKEEDKS